MGIGHSAYLKHLEKGLQAVHVDDITDATKHFNAAIASLQTTVAELHQPIDVDAAKKQRQLALLQSAGGGGGEAGGSDDMPSPSSSFNRLRHQGAARNSDPGQQPSPPTTSPSTSAAAPPPRSPAGLSSSGTHLGTHNALFSAWQLSPAASRVPSRQQAFPPPPPLAVVPPTPYMGNRGGAAAAGNSSAFNLISPTIKQPPASRNQQQRDNARERRSSWAGGLTGAVGPADDMIMESLSQHSSAGGRDASWSGDDGISGLTARGTSNGALTAGRSPNHGGGGARDASSGGAGGAGGAGGEGGRAAANGDQQLFEFVSRDELPIVGAALKLRVDIGVAFMNHFLSASTQRDSESYLLDLAGRQFAIAEPVARRLRAQLFGHDPTLLSAAVDDAYAACHLHLAEIRLYQYKTLEKSGHAAASELVLNPLANRPTIAAAAAAADQHEEGGPAAEQPAVLEGGWGPTSLSSASMERLPAASHKELILDYLWTDANAHVEALKRFASEKYALIDERLIPIFNLDAELLALKSEWRKAIMTKQRCVGYCVSRFGLNDIRTLARREELAAMKMDFRTRLAAERAALRQRKSDAASAAAVAMDSLSDDEFFTSNGDIITFIPAPVDPQRRAVQSA